MGCFFAIEGVSRHRDNLIRKRSAIPSCGVFVAKKTALVKTTRAVRLLFLFRVFLRFDHAILHVPKLFRKVNVIVMGVIKALNLFPNALLGSVAMRADLLNARQIIHLLTVLEDRHKQLFRLEVFKRLALPRVFGIKNFKRLRVVHRFVPHANQIRLCLASVFAKQTIDLFEVGRGPCLQGTASIRHW